MSTILYTGTKGAEVTKAQSQLWDMLQDNPQLMAQVRAKLPESKHHFLQSKKAFADGDFGSVTEAAVSTVQQFFQNKSLKVGADT
ncbi:MAG: hypothetical protein P8P30_09790 [Rickettsiales bacterium]|nr:hypothetical protein [Rickettsiales bacterium]